MLNDFTMIMVVGSHAVAVGEEQGGPHAGETAVATARGGCLRDSREHRRDRDQNNAGHQNETVASAARTRPDDRKPES